MPKIPQREGTIQQQGLPSTATPQPIDPTGGLRQVANVAGRVASDVNARVTRAKVKAEGEAVRLQDLAYDNAMTALTGPMMARMQEAGNADVMDPMYPVSVEEEFNKGHAAFAETMTPEAVERNAPKYDAALLAMEFASKKRYRAAHAEAYKKESEVHLQNTKNGFISTFALSGLEVSTAMTDIKAGVAEVGREIRDGFRPTEDFVGPTRGIASEFLTPPEVDEVVLDEQRSLVNESIRTATIAGNHEVAKAIYTEYTTLLRGTPWENIGSNHISDYINNHSRDDRVASLAGDVITELYLGANWSKYLDDNGFLNQAGEALLAKSLTGMSESNPEEFAAANARIATLKNQYDAAAVAKRGRRTEAKIKELTRAGGTWEATQSDYDLLGVEGVATVYAALGKDANRKTAPGALNAWDNRTDRDDPVKSRAYLRQNMGAFSEITYHSLMSTVDSMEATNARAAKDPQTFGTMTAPQSLAHAKIAAKAGGAWFYDEDKGTLTDSESAAKFEELVATSIAEHGGYMTPEVAQRIGRKALALMVVNKDTLGVDRFWSRDIEGNYHDYTKLTEAARSGNLDATDVNEFSRSFVDRHGIGGSDAATTANNLVDTLTVAAKTALPGAEPNKITEMIVEGMTRGGDSADPDVRRMWQHASVRDPSLLKLDIGMKSIVPYEFRKQVIAIYTAEHKQWDEDDILGEWVKHIAVHDKVDAEGMQRLRQKPGSFIDYLVNSNGLSITNWFESRRNSNPGDYVPPVNNRLSPRGDRR